MEGDPLSIVEDKNENKTRARKRKQRNQSEWKREKRKRLIIAGEPHMSVRGELIESKQIGADCKCKLKCYEKVSESSRKMLFEGFYALKSYDEQNAYLFGLIRKHDVKRKKKHNSDRRTCTYKYYIRIRGKEIHVCKLAFAHIHAISFRKIRTLSDKLDLNILFPRDGRGKHDNRPTRILPDTVNLIKGHIFAVIESNVLRSYLRDDKTSPIASELNVAKLYINFLQCNEPESIDPETIDLKAGYSPKVKSWLYRKVFQEQVKPTVYPLIRTRLADIDKSAAVASDVKPKKNLKRKGLTKNIERNGSDSLITASLKPVQDSNVPIYVAPSQDSDIPMPFFSPVPIQKSMHQAASYHPEHMMQDISHGNKDPGNAVHHQMLVSTPMFEHRMHQFQNEGHGSHQVINANEMSNAFFYSSHC